MTKEIKNTEGLMHKIKSMMQDLPTIIEIDNLADEHNSDRGYKDP